MDDSGEIVFRDTENPEAPPGSESEFSGSENEGENEHPNDALNGQAGDREPNFSRVEEKLNEIATCVTQRTQALQKQFENSLGKFERKLNDFESRLSNETLTNVNNSGTVNRTGLGSLGAEYRVSDVCPDRVGDTPNSARLLNPSFDITRNHVQNKIKPQNYDGSDDLDEYLAHFNIVSELNGWNYNTKSLFLASSLKGACLSLLNDLDQRQCRDYESLVQALQNRYGTKNRAEIFRSKLQTRTQTKHESIPELAQSIRKLTRQAYPSASSEVLDLLALDYFIDALPDTDMRLRLREICPKTVSEAEKIAVRLEAHKVADKTRGRHQVRAVEPMNQCMSSNTKIDSLADQVKSLKDELARMKSQQNRKNVPIPQGFRGARNQSQNRQNITPNDRQPGYFRQNERPGNFHWSNQRTDVRPHHQGPLPRTNQRQ